MKKTKRFSITGLSWLIASLLLLFAGCKKSGGGGGGDGVVPQDEYYYRARLNGVMKDFLHAAIFQGGGNDGRWEHIVFSGHESSVPATPNLEDVPPQFGIEIWNMGGNISAGTYTESGSQSGDSDLPGDYSVEGQYLIQTANQGTIQYDGRETLDFTMVITEISKEKGIKGTFHGTLTNQDNSAEVITVTDGEFCLPYKTLINP